MRLKRWLKEPESYRLLAIFAGDRREMLGFLQVWLRWRGHLELTAGQLDPARLVREAQAAPPQLALATPIDRLPSYFLVNWWLERPAQWRLLYQPLEQPSRSEFSAAPAAPAGVYLPWGYCLEPNSGPDLGAHPGQSSATAILWEEGWEQGKSLALPQEYKNLVEMLDKGPIIFEPPDGHSLREVVPVAQSPGGATQSLAIRLEKALDRRGSTNPRVDLHRIRHRIQELTEQAATLEWQLGEREPAIELAVYRETLEERLGVGTSWDLRNWFVRASTEATQEFLHARIAVKGLGPLHLALPKDFHRVPKAKLPSAAYRLRLDRHWWRRHRRQVFVTQGLELLPAPPISNEHTAGLLEAALWEGARPDETILVMLETNDGERYRFTVGQGEFALLSDHLGQLNFDVARNSRARDPEPDAMQELLRQARAALSSTVLTHANTMQQELDSIWEHERVDLTRYRQQVAEAVQAIARVRSQIVETEKLRQEVRQGLGKDWRDWTGFLHEALELDRKLMPAFRTQIADWLGQLDQTRIEISNLWEKPDNPQSRLSAATRLRHLADQLSPPKQETNESES